MAEMDLLREYVYHGTDPAIPPHLRLVHVDESPYQIGKNYPVEVGVLGDTRSALSELDALLAAQMSADDRQRRAARSQSRASLHRQIQARLREQIERDRDVR